MQNGKWDDDGPGWKEHPDVKAALNPLGIDDGATTLPFAMFIVDSLLAYVYFLRASNQLLQQVEHVC